MTTMSNPPQLPPSVESAPSSATPVVPPNVTTPIDQPVSLQPTQPAVRYPPFPPIPEGVTILPFSQFQEHGIQIFTDPETGVEIDGLGIPTVRLRVPHNTDVRKTRPPPGAKVANADGDAPDEEEGEGDEEAENGKDGKGKKKKKKKRIGEKGKGKEPIDYTTIKDPIERAQEQKRQRLLLFAKKDWWDQWAEGEDLRKGRIYDTNLSPTDRIHMAATEFRVGRMWPPSSSRLRFLWDQFRLFIGLLGSTPVWIRTDLPQQEGEDDDDDDDESSDFDSGPPPAVRGYAGENPGEVDKGVPQSQSQRRKATVESDSEDEFAQARYSDEEELEEEPPEEKQGQNPTTKPPPQKHKRIPPRPPYALYNIHPIPISSPTHIPILLSLASTQRHTKLLTFLSSPSLATRIFLSSYIHIQGLIYSPLYLTSLPRLVLFFLEFLIRVRALPELSRELRSAVGIARRAVEEVPRTGWVCRNFPDVMGRGCRGVWGVRWVREGWVLDEGMGGLNENGGGGDMSAVEADETKQETEEEAMRRFEDELRAANVQLMPADPADLGIPPDTEESSASLSSVEEEDENAVGDLSDDGGKGNIRIEIMSPTSPGYIEPESAAAVEGGGAFIEEILEENEVRIAEDKGVSKRGEDAEKVVDPSREDNENDGEVVEAEEKTRQNVSPTAPEAEADAEAVTAEVRPTNADQAKHTPDAPNWALAPDSPPQSTATIHSGPTDWSSPNGPSHPTPAQQKAAREAWLHPPEQPLLPILGSMSVFPLCFEAGGKDASVGVVERSMRRVKEVLRAGEERGKEKERGWRMRGVEEDLVDKFARVTLDPWLDWDDAGVAGEYKVPKVQGPGPLPLASSSSGAQGDAEGEAQAHELSEIIRRRAKYTHDAFKDDITLLVEPRVAENIGVGMGLAGTWVQLVPAMNPFDQWEGGKSGGRGRGRGRGGRGGRGGADGREGRGRGRGRGRAGASGQPGQAEAESATPTQEQKKPTQPRSPTFWFVEEIYMAVPSFWTVGEPEEDLGKALAEALAERGEGGVGEELDLEDGLDGLDGMGAGEVAMVMERD